MNSDQILLLSAAIFVIALLYSSVGHAGASGYIAIMTLAGLAPSFIKPTALILNILVASLTTIQFFRAGYFSWRLFWPFAMLSIPAAFLGGYLNLSTGTFKILLGMVLLYSAARFLIKPKPDGAVHTPAVSLSLGVGAGLGFLSGLTGTGGGIFLTPLLIFSRWAQTKTAAATSAFFILANSVSGLLGNFGSTKTLPLLAFPLALAVIAGGGLGSYLGSRKFSPIIIKRCLACVLIIAGIKLIAT